MAAALGSLTACTAEQNGDAVTGIIPAPTSFELREEAPFRLTGTSRLVADGEGAAAVAETFARQARAATGFELPVVEGEPAASDLSFVVADGEAPEAAAEGYTLESGDGGVRVAADTAAGLFRGTQSLRQLLPAAIERADAAAAPDGGWIVPAASVADAPRFAYRGAMLDVARHFFPVEDVLRYLDAIALLKLNVLHLHLTDDQGWRIRIDAWPELTGVGASTSVGGDGGGSYTKDDYRRIVEYAAERFITIVPEIDLPGHTNAALSAYPELNCDGVAPAPVRGHRGRLLVALRRARACRRDRPVPGRRHARARRAHARAVAAPRRRRVAVDEPRRLPRPRAADDAGRRRDRQDGHRVARDGRLAGAARGHRRAVLELRRARGRRGGAHPLVRRAGRAASSSRPPTSPTST